MAITLPIGIRVAAGLLGTAFDRLSTLPDDLPTIGVTVAGQLLRTSMRVRQEVAELATRGDDLLSGITGRAEEHPAWATFDDEDDTAAVPDPQHADVAGTAEASNAEPGTADTSSAEASSPEPDIAEASSADPEALPGRKRRASGRAGGTRKTAASAKTAPVRPGPADGVTSDDDVTSDDGVTSDGAATNGATREGATGGAATTDGADGHPGRRRAGRPRRAATRPEGPASADAPISLTLPDDPATGPHANGQISADPGLPSDTDHTGESTTNSARELTRKSARDSASSNHPTPDRPPTPGRPPTPDSAQAPGSAPAPDADPDTPTQINGDHGLSIAELKDRLQGLDVAAVRQLLALEEAGPNRAPYLTLLGNRLTTLQHENR